MSALTTSVVLAVVVGVPAWAQTAPSSSAPMPSAPAAAAPAAVPTTKAAPTAPTTAAAADAPTSTAPVQVFFATMTAGPGADPEVGVLFEDRILASARNQRAFKVLGRRDVQTLVDYDANLQKTGCETDVDCAAEIAGALNVPQVLTGQLGRIGQTWMLTLTRSDRSTLDVQARVVREAQGETPEALLPYIDSAVAEVFGAEVPAPSSSMSPLVVVGGVAAGVGVAALAVAGGLTAWSWQTYTDAEGSLNNSTGSVADKEQIRRDAIANGEALNVAATVGFVAGGVLVVAGAGAAALAWGME